MWWETHGLATGFDIVTTEAEELWRKSLLSKVGLSNCWQLFELDKICGRQEIT